MRTEIKAHLYDIEAYFKIKLTVPQLKRLCELEREGHLLAEAYCNGTIQEETRNVSEARLLNEIVNILKISTESQDLYLNFDPRGYFLKIDCDALRCTTECDIERDWGGYGILCPENIQNILLGEENHE
jgi:hypothetical protein